jgi:hypothetical protein
MTHCQVLIVRSRYLRQHSGILLEKSSSSNLNHIGLWRLCGDGDRPTGCQALDGWANGKALVSLNENVYIMTIIASFFSL